jgi:hypothetical protein
VPVETNEDSKIEKQTTFDDAGREHRALGDVTGKIDGKWQEFRIRAAGGSVASGCTSRCSAASTSEPLGTNTSPWKYTTRSCTRVEVVQGYGAGIAYYDVYDNGEKIYTTSVGDDDGETSTTNPATAWTNPKFGKGTKKRPAGTHSIVIKTNWMNPDYGSAAGWFRIRTVDCVECVASGVSCATGTCCSGLICRRKVGDPSTAPNKCLPCSQYNQRCVKDTDCCNGRRCLLDASRVKRCF